MKVVVQLVKSASVAVPNRADPVSEIGRGLCLFVAVEPSDDDQLVDRISSKVLSLRLFPDASGKLWQRSVVDIDGHVLLVSNFTLAADLGSGTRPSFSRAASPRDATSVLARLESSLVSGGVKVLGGAFGQEMDVTLTNWGPSTFLLA